MKTKIIQKKDYNVWDDLLTAEIRPILNNAGVKLCGITFLGGPQGVLCYGPGDDGYKIHYIYVSPDTRHMGLATEMVRFVCCELYKDGVTELGYSFTSQDNRIGLRGFFEAVGGVSEVISFPYSSILATDFTSSKMIEEYDGDDVAAVSNLLPSQKGVVDEFIKKTTGGSLSEYSDSELSCAIVFKNEVKAIALFSKEDDTLYHLDYYYSAAANTSQTKLLGFIKHRLLKLKNLDDVVIDMIFKNNQAMKMLKHFSKNIGDIDIVQGFIDVDTVYDDAAISKLIG